MKKIIWLLFLLPIFMTKVSANEIYYSEYSEFSDYQTESVVKTDTINVETQLNYHVYKENKIIGEYKSFNENELFTDDCYYEYSEWYLGKKNLTNEIEVKKEYVNQISKPVRYIHFNNIKDSSSFFRITEIKITANGKIVDYDYICEGCSNDFGENIKNGILQETETYINNDGNLILDLKEEYPAKHINIEFYIFNIDDTDKRYTIEYSTNTINTYASYHNMINFSNYGDASKHTYNVTNLNDESEWTYIKIDENILKSSYLIGFSERNYYRYKYPYCRTYSIEKEYGGYAPTTSENYPYKDINDTVLKYRYQTREKIEILPEIIINSYDFDLSKIVIYSNTDFQIRENINYFENGIYDIFITTPNMNIPKKVKVDIFENTKKEYEEQIVLLNNKIEKNYEEYQQKLENEKSKNETLESKINYLKKLNEAYDNKINELMSGIDKANLNIKDVVLHEQEIIAYYENEILNYKQQISLLENNSDDYCEDNYKKLKQEIENETLENEFLNTKVNKYLLQIKNQRKSVLILFMFLGLLLIIYLLKLYFLRKKSNANFD